MCYIGSAAKFKLSSNITTIQYSRQMRSHAIFETKNETQSWLPLQNIHYYALNFSFCFIYILQQLMEL